MITYRSFISACARGLQANRALQLHLAMQPEELMPNVISYMALISACAKCLREGRSRRCRHYVSRPLPAQCEPDIGRRDFQGWLPATQGLLLGNGPHCVVLVNVLSYLCAAPTKYAVHSKLDRSSQVVPGPPRGSNRACPLSFNSVR